MTETVSWRDVQKAVQDSKTEILRAIDDLKKDTIQDHEERLRTVEKRTDAVQFLTRAFIALVAVVSGFVVILRNLGII